MVNRKIILMKMNPQCALKFGCLMTLLFFVIGATPYNDHSCQNLNGFNDCLFQSQVSESNACSPNHEACSIYSNISQDTYVCIRCMGGTGLYCKCNFQQNHIQVSEALGTCNYIDLYTCACVADLGEQPVVREFWKCVPRR